MATIGINKPGVSGRRSLETGRKIVIPPGSSWRFKIAAGIEYCLAISGVTIALEKKGGVRDFERLHFVEDKNRHNIRCGVIDSEDDWDLRVQSYHGGEIELFVCETLGGTD